MIFMNPNVFASHGWRVDDGIDLVIKGLKV